MPRVDPSKGYRLFYPTVPVIVSSSNGVRVSAMPVASAISISNAPPLVGFCSARSHSTYETVKSSGTFSMCWLDSRFMGAVQRLGERTGVKVRDKLELVGLRHHPGEVLPVPVIAEASATVECAVIETLSLGDHELVVGEVKAAYANSDFKDYWQFKRYRPILYAGSPDGFRTYAADAPRARRPRSSSSRHSQLSPRRV